MSRRRGPTPARKREPLVLVGTIRAGTEGAVLDGQLWENDRYRVIVREPEHLGPDCGVELPEGFVWLNIVPKSKGRHGHDWREFQAIKDELVGPDREGFELYPPHDNVVDTSNAWHLWVLPEGLRLPVGFHFSRKVYAVPGDRSTEEVAQAR